MKVHPTYVSFFTSTIQSLLFHNLNKQHAANDYSDHSVIFQFQSRLLIKAWLNNKYCHRRESKIIHVRLQILTYWQAALYEFRDPRAGSNLGLTFPNLIKTEMECICAYVCSCVEGITRLERIFEHAISHLLPDQVPEWTSGPKTGC